VEDEEQEAHTEEVREEAPPPVAPASNLAEAAESGEEELQGDGVKILSKKEKEKMKKEREKAKKKAQAAAKKATGAPSGPADDATVHTEEGVREAKEEAKEEVKESDSE